MTTPQEERVIEAAERVASILDEMGVADATTEQLRVEMVALVDLQDAVEEMHRVGRRAN